MSSVIFSQSMDMKEGKFRIWIEGNDDGVLHFNISKDDEVKICRELKMGNVGKDKYIAIEEKPVGLFMFIDYSKITGITIIGAFSVNQGVAPLMIIKDKVVKDENEGVVLTPMISAIINSIIEGDIDFDYIISQKIREFKTDKMMEQFLKLAPDSIPILCEVIRELKDKIPLNTCKPIFLQSSAPLFKLKVRDLFEEVVKLLEMVSMANILELEDSNKKEGVEFTREMYKMFKERLEATLHLSQVEVIDIYIRNFGRTLYGIALGILRNEIPFLLPFVIADIENIDDFFDRLNNQIKEIPQREVAGVFLMPIETAIDTKIWKRVFFDELEKRKEYFKELMDSIANLIEVMRPYEEENNEGE